MVYGLGLFASLTAGMFVRARSPGALDDGAACAVLIRLAERLKASGPLPHTEVEIALLSGEEIGVHGSWEYARQRFTEPPDLPTAVVNLEFIGAASDLATFGSEKFSLRSFPPDPALLALLDGVHHQQRQKPLYVTWYGAATDARSFLAHGIPAMTLASDLPGSRAAAWHARGDGFARSHRPGRARLHARLPRSGRARRRPTRAASRELTPGAARGIRSSRWMTTTTPFATWR